MAFTKNGAGSSLGVINVEPKPEPTLQPVVEVRK